MKLNDAMDQLARAFREKVAAYQEMDAACMTKVRGALGGVYYE